MKKKVDKLISSIDSAHSLSAVLITALEEYANNPSKIDINSILDTVRVIDRKLEKAISDFIDKTTAK